MGDLLFINDVWPKDWVSFFSGRPLEYLKIGVDGLRTRYSSKIINADLLVIPFFTPDNMPGHDRFFFFDPFAAVPIRTESQPEDTFENIEAGLRLYRPAAGFDVSVYLYRGFWRAPSVLPDNPAAPTAVALVYPDLDVFGASAQGALFGGVLSLEAAYYHSPRDQSGADPLTPNSNARFLAGFQMQPLEDTTVGAQYYGELMLQHDNYENTLPAGFPRTKRYRDIVTLRLGRMLLHQSLDISFFAFYGVADADYLLRPAVGYKFSDRLAGTIGGNIFGGEKDHTFFGQFDKNDNVYVNVRLDF